MTRTTLKCFACVIAFSCWAIIPSQAQSKSSLSRAEVPLKIKQGDLLVSARINRSQLVTFKLDTGFGITTIKPALAESLHLERAGGLTIDGIAGEERAATFRNAEL